MLRPALALVLLAVFFFGPHPVRAQDFAELKEIENYRKWSFIKGPFRVSPGMALLCVHPPFLSHPGTEGAGKSGAKEVNIQVFANGRAATTLDDDSKKVFPPGSVILKEKYVAPGKAPDSLGIMIKREPGFDPEVGDWEFIFLADGKKIARGQKDLKNCYDCHGTTDSVFGHRPRDFVFMHTE